MWSVLEKLTCLTEAEFGASGLRRLVCRAASVPLLACGPARAVRRHTHKVSRVGGKQHMKTDIDPDVMLCSPQRGGGTATCVIVIAIVNACRVYGSASLPSAFLS